MKKFWIIIFIILFFGVGGLSYLWYLGAPKTPFNGHGQNFVTVETVTLSRPTIRPPEDRDGNGLNDWEEKFYGNDKIISLVIQALKQKQEPLLSLEVLPVSLSNVYELSDLKLTEQTSEITLANYSKELLQVMSDYRTPSLGKELNLILEITEEGDSDREIQSEIIRLANRYRASVGKLLSLTVPRSASHIHLNLINNLARLSGNAWLMAQINEEPIIALSASQFQTSQLRQTLTAIGNINLFFAGHNLGLQNKESVIALDL